LPLTSIEESVAVDEQSAMPFIINNIGPGQLDYNISRLMFNGKSDPVAKTATLPEPLGYHPLDDKGGDTEPFFAPVTKNRSDACFSTMIFK